MSTVAVKVRRVEPGDSGGGGTSALDRDLELARKLATLLDAQFGIGPVRFGLDAIIGLIPGVGDMVSAGLGAYLVYLAHKHKLGFGVVAVMSLILFLDWLIGLVPVVGDLGDVAFKANLINLSILQKAAAQRRGAPL